MVKTTKELRVFRNNTGLYVRPISKGEPDRGLSLSSDFEHCSDGVQGSEYLDSEYDRIRRLRCAISIVLLTVTGGPHIILSLMFGVVPKALSVAVILLAAITLIWQAGLLTYRYKDRVGNIYDMRDSCLRLKDGTRIRVVGGR